MSRGSRNLSTGGSPTASNRSGRHLASANRKGVGESRILTTGRESPYAFKRDMPENEVPLSKPLALGTNRSSL